MDAEHLALDVIESVGPGGNFMVAPHTMKHMRTEYFQGNGVSDKKSRSKWEDNGSMDARENARKIAKKLVANRESTYIAPEVDGAIREKFNILL